MSVLVVFFVVEGVDSISWAEVPSSIAALTSDLLDSLFRKTNTCNWSEAAVSVM